MAESKEHRPSKTGFSPSGYLPRLWRAAPEPSTAPVPAKKKKKKTRGASAGATPARGQGEEDAAQDVEAEGTRKGVLFEETPALDTIEVRRTVRIITGTVATLLVLLLGFLLYRVVTGKSAGNAHPADEKIELVDIRKIRERNETEAREMIARAREVARHGNNKLALSLLTRVSTVYPETRAASEAREALVRPSQHLPLFPDGPPESAEPADPKSSTATTAAGPGPPRAGSAPPAVNSEAPATAAAPTTPAQLPDNPEAAARALAGNAPTPTPAQAAVSPANPEAALAASTPMPSPSPTPSAPAMPANPGRTLPAGFQARTGVGHHPSGWPLEIVGARDGAMMVLVPGGPFVQGRDGSDPEEAPAHLVKVSTFYIDKHEVTNREFEIFLKETGPRADRIAALARGGDGVSHSEDFPVVMVNAKDARDYADWAGKRLPTETQWEKAARGTDLRLYPWGPLPPVWDKQRVPRQIDAVMSFPNDLSPYGAYDMAGNAMEWTRDWFDPNAYASFRGALAEDPTGPTNRPQTLQVTVKGGSKQWIITAREGIKLDARLPYLGFRCVLPVEGPDSVFQAPPAPIAPAQPAPGAARKKAVVPF